MKKYVKTLLLFGNILVSLAALAAYLSPYVPPSQSSIIALLGLLFPVLLIFNLLYIAIWSILKSKIILLPIFILCLGWSSIFKTISLCPPNEKLTKKEKRLRVATYNLQFSKPVTLHAQKAAKEKDFLNFLKQHGDIDILGVQECGANSRAFIEKAFQFPYRYFLKNAIVGIYSKYPIVNRGYIDFGVNYINTCLWADIKIGKDTIRFYSTHLEANRTNGLSPEMIIAEEIAQLEKLDNLAAKSIAAELSMPMQPLEKLSIITDTIMAASKEIIPIVNKRKSPPSPPPSVAVFIDEEKPEKTNYLDLFGIVKHYQRFTAKRAEQAKLIRAHQKMSPYPSIICGDFNDPPLSYVYSIMTDGMEDSFLKAGKGIGTTIKNLHGLRIDYIFCDPKFKIPYHHIFRKPYSDHAFVTTTIGLSR